MKKKNILFVLFIVFGIPLLFLTLLIGGGVWLYTSISKPPEQVKQIEQQKNQVVKDEYNVEALNFVDFTDHLSLEKNTSMHVSYFWESAKGKRVKWTGKVLDVKGGQGKAEITVINKKKPASDGYNIMLVSYKPGQAAALKKGEYITFSGELYNYKRRSDHSIIVYLNNAEILH